MSGQPVASGSNLGGSRIAGQRNDKSQKSRETAIKHIKEMWGVSEFIDVFPASIKPDSELGDSAIAKLRAIAKKVPKLSDAKELMLAECVDAAGNRTKISFKHTTNILEYLKDTEAKEPDKKKKEDGLDDEESKKNKLSNTGTPSKSGSRAKSTPTALASSPISGSTPSKVTKPYKRPPPHSHPAVQRGYANLMYAAQDTPNEPAKSPLIEKPSRLGKVKGPGLGNTVRPTAKPDVMKGSAKALSEGLATTLPAVAKPTVKKEAAKVLPEGPAIARGSVAKPDFKKGADKARFESPANIGNMLSGLHVTASDKGLPRANITGINVNESEAKGNTAKKSSVKDFNFKKRGPIAPEDHATVVKKARQAEAVSPAVMREDTAACLSAAEVNGKDVMTDDLGLTTGLKSHKTSSSLKRPHDDEDELPFKKLKFDKESILKELKFVKRDPPKESTVTAGQTPSEGGTEADDESIGSPFPETHEDIRQTPSGDEAEVYDESVADEESTSSDNSIPSPFGAKKVKKNVLIGEDAGKNVTKKGEKKLVDVAASAHKLVGDMSIDPTQKIKELKQVFGQNRTAPMHHPSSDISIAAGKQKVEKGKAPEVRLDSPRSPISADDPEEYMDTSAAFAALKPEVQADLRAQFSNKGKTRVNSTITKKLPPFSKDIAQKQLSTEKDTMGNYYHDDSDEGHDRYSRSRIQKKSFGDNTRPILTRKLPANADDMSVSDYTLPKLPDVITPQIPEDRALITSIPSIIRDYLEDFRASITDSKAPNGELLNMIIVNKYGYLLDHIDKFEKEMEQLFWQAIDKDIELEKKELEKKEREERKKKDQEEKESGKKDFEKDREDNVPFI